MPNWASWKQSELRVQAEAAAEQNNKKEEEKKEFISPALSRHRPELASVSRSPVTRLTPCWARDPATGHLMATINKPPLGGSGYPPGTAPGTRTCRITPHCGCYLTSDEGVRDIWVS